MTFPVQAGSFPSNNIHLRPLGWARVEQCGARFCLGLDLIRVVYKVVLRRSGLQFASMAPMPEQQIWE